MKATPHTSIEVTYEKGHGVERHSTFQFTSGFLKILEQECFITITLQISVY